ncbi:type II toxin-antitoxin system HipA family toxin [Candidatus Neptunochlamydia vexilliferae]|uniref:Uncharacterized protein n=1 Tax=Candidatus Neptunichlamydia vexilliferae TaxID=1651774 RepID=A0ABS0AWU1_9BACT|nr:type II toxin-antitoxin system HipA family toxin [Candidatus Neptunochlamydia vexilliferae]MBF5058604.1 hypothetical protein [Candidatus Neptunochlamydia vexilliferae]
MTVNKLYVYFMQGEKKIPLGTLALKQRKILFEYAPEFIETKLEISPFKLPLKRGVQQTEDFLFEGLFGVFNDSLPDGWGRLLLDRKLMTLGIHPETLSPLDRLSYVGQRGMGALIYEPEIEGALFLNHADLDAIAEEARQFEENDDDRFVDDLLAMNGSSAGARPKILIPINGEDWLIKFRSSVDPKDIGPIEYAYHLMAEKALLNVPEAKLFPSRKGPGYFGTKRFDRIEKKRVHMHTMSGLLHADFRLPSLDYKTIMKATAFLTKDLEECEKQFRAMVFNVLSHNRDDHAKNFSFLMDEEGSWSVAPPYDLTFSSGPAGEHSTMVAGEGKTPKRSNLLKVAELGSIAKERAVEIIEEVALATSNWETFAKEAGVNKTSLSLIKKNLSAIAKSL